MKTKTLAQSAAAVVVGTLAAASLLTLPGQSNAADAPPPASSAVAPGAQASIGGTVVDTAGAPVAGVILEWADPLTVTRRQVSAPDGTFLFVGMTNTPDGSIRLLGPQGYAIKSIKAPFTATTGDRLIGGISFNGNVTITGMQIVVDPKAGLKPVEYVRETNRAVKLAPISELALAKNKRLMDDLTPGAAWASKQLVAGRVEDTAGNVVGGIAMTLTQVAGGSTWSQAQVSAVDGEFRFGDVPDGTYKLTVNGPLGTKIVKMTAPTSTGGIAKDNVMEGITVRGGMIAKGAVITVDVTAVM